MEIEEEVLRTPQHVEEVERVIERVVPRRFARPVAGAPKYQVLQRFIEVPKPVVEKRVVEVPEIEYRERIVEVPQYVVEEKIVQVPKIIHQEQVIRVPKRIVQEKIVEVDPEELTRIYRGEKLSSGPERLPEVPIGRSVERSPERPLGQLPAHPVPCSVSPPQRPAVHRAPSFSESEPFHLQPPQQQPAFETAPPPLALSSSSALHKSPLACQTSQFASHVDFAPYTASSAQKPPHVAPRPLFSSRSSRPLSGAPFINYTAAPLSNAPQGAPPAASRPLQRHLQTVSAGPPTSRPPPTAQQFDLNDPWVRDAFVTFNIEPSRLVRTVEEDKMLQTDARRDRDLSYRWWTSQNMWEDPVLLRHIDHWSRWERDGETGAQRNCRAAVRPSCCGTTHASRRLPNPYRQSEVAVHEQLHPEQLHGEELLYPDHELQLEESYPVAFNESTVRRGTASPGLFACLRRLFSRGAKQATCTCGAVAPLYDFSQLSPQIEYRPVQIRRPVAVPTPIIRVVEEDRYITGESARPGLSVVHC